MLERPDLVMMGLFVHMTKLAPLLEHAADRCILALLQVYPVFQVKVFPFSPNNLIDECDGKGGCITQPNYCLIAGTCFAEGATSPSSQCKVLFFFQKFVNKCSNAWQQPLKQTGQMLIVLMVL